VKTLGFLRVRWDTVEGGFARALSGQPSDISHTLPKSIIMEILHGFSMEFPAQFF
jgi:hypothetical protein